ncbi:hypothetical protein RHSP_12948 [Rhizobium freirei PRF 81]|uniref:Uncharacterized protein n=1 Tax=Rhizobium freirei PRF 81 TaxID=363754 RepID=N6UZG2_9HYPH|nr:hypothetical protein RHSP_12948 [Rhizobium freirei PRF 81]
MPNQPAGLPPEKKATRQQQKPDQDGLRRRIAGELEPEDRTYPHIDRCEQDGAAVGRLFFDQTPDADSNIGERQVYPPRQGSLVLRSLPLFLFGTKDDCGDGTAMWRWPNKIPTILLLLRCLQIRHSPSVPRKTTAFARFLPSLVGEFNQNRRYRNQMELVAESRVAHALSAVPKS